MPKSHSFTSPSNVLLSFEGEVKLCDFGIARANPLAGEMPEDSIVGKAGYMSPEHARGESLDERADVFAAGIILWELLAGRRLYKAGPAERLLDVARAALIPELEPRGLENESDLHAIVGRALEPARDQRYPTAAAMLHDLEEYAASTRMMASPIRFGEWLMEHLGGEVVGTRRARERVVQALARGPAAVIEPIGGARLPDYEMTPSAFPVALRADSMPGVVEEGRSAMLPDPRDAVRAAVTPPVSGAAARSAAVPIASADERVSIPKPTRVSIDTPLAVKAFAPRRGLEVAKVIVWGTAAAILVVAVIWFALGR